MSKKTIMITGASRGYGRGLLDEFVSKGWVAFPIIRQNNTADSLRDLYPEMCFPVVADVRDNDLDEKINRVVSAHAEHLDLLINNAGQVKKSRGFANALPEDLLSHFDTHCVGVLRCVKAALPFLRKSANPLIVNISSRWSSIALTAGGLSLPGKDPLYAYKMAKCAQNMLTVCLNTELVPEGIPVVPVHPGRIRTESAAADADLDIEQAARILYEWVMARGQTAECRLHDLSSDSTIDW